MAIAMLVDNPEVTQETYDKVREHLTSRGPPAGFSTSPGPLQTAGGASSSCGIRKRRRADSSRSGWGPLSKPRGSQVSLRSRSSGRFTTT